MPRFKSRVVQTGNVADGSITNVKIADGTIANAKMDVDEGHNIEIKRKSAQEDVNNSTTLQNDDHLVSATLAANTTWSVDILINVFSSVGATPDGQIGFTLPAGAAWFIGANANLSTAEAAQQITSQSGGNAVTFGVSTPIRLLLLRGWVVIGSTAGTLQVQWAQATAAVENVSFGTNSHMILRRIV